MERIEKQIVVNKGHGLHVRPATIFVQMANKFNSSVKLERGGEIVDGKSIIAILSLGINKGMDIRLIVEGEDNQEAMEELKNFLEGDDE